MRSTERIEFALRPLGESRKPAALADRANAIAPSSEHLVRIGLMADVPHEAIARGVEDVMQRDRELDHAKPGAEMTSGHGDCVDRLRAQLIRNLAKRVRVKSTQVFRGVYEVEQRRFSRLSHLFLHDGPG